MFNYWARMYVYILLWIRARIAVRFLIISVDFSFSELFYRKFDLSKLYFGNSPTSEHFFVKFFKLLRSNSYHAPGGIGSVSAPPLWCHQFAIILQKEQEEGSGKTLTRTTESSYARGGKTDSVLSLIMDRFFSIKIEFFLAEFGNIYSGNYQLLIWSNSGGNHRTLL